MKKNLTKITTIILLAFSMILANFSMTVRAVEPKVQTAQSIEVDSVKEDTKDTVNLPELEEINNSIDLGEEEVKQEEDVDKIAPLKFPELNTNNIVQGNNYPIVLVHGFMGFGRDELLGYKYWGGIVDVQEKLNDLGYKTYTATVGPVSSNWDRACELYAYIVGAQ